MVETIPSKVFIIPYRNRERDKILFLGNMKLLLEDSNESYEIYFAHQCDNRPFNRGAMKNIGFLAVKEKYPNHYQNITFIFHDVDTWPSKKGMIDYSTKAGIVKHYYGYTFALGGMFAIKGADFEITKGFPNFWGWGMEDNTINDRCLATGLKIDRSCFYDITDKTIVRTFDGFSRIISQRDSYTYKHETPDDINALKKVTFKCMNQTPTIIMIQITQFESAMNPNDQSYKPIDIRRTRKLIVSKPYQFRRDWKMFQR